MARSLFLLGRHKLAIEAYKQVKIVYTSEGLWNLIKIKRIWNQIQRNQEAWSCRRRTVPLMEVIGRSLTTSGSAIFTSSNNMSQYVTSIHIKWQTAIFTSSNNMSQYVTSIHIKWQTAIFTSSYNISCLSYVTICDLNTPQVTICHPFISSKNMSRLSQVTISYLNKPQGTNSHLYLN